MLCAINRVLGILCAIVMLPIGAGADTGGSRCQPREASAIEQSDPHRVAGECQRRCDRDAMIRAAREFLPWWLRYAGTPWSRIPDADSRTYRELQLEWERAVRACAR